MIQHLWYAEAAGHIYEASKKLDDAIRPLCNAKDDELYRKVLEKRVELWSLIKEVMDKGATMKE